MKHAHPVRYWALRVGGFGLLGGFIAAQTIYKAPPVAALGMALPLAIIFAGIGVIAGLIVKARG